MRVFTISVDNTVHQRISLSFLFYDLNNKKVKERENATENRNEVLEWNRYKTLKGIRRMKITYQPT